ncbi:MAG: hypothetical protein ACRD1L_06485 [Terriglobales bacterium]
MPINLTGPPEPVLYRLLFKAAVALDQGARRREAAGKDPGPMREFYARHGGMNLGENGIVFQVAAEATAAESADVAQQKKLIAEWRAAMRQHVLGAGPLPAPPLPQLQQLQADRDAIAMRERDQLHQMLGDDGFYRLEVYIHRRFGHARHMTLKLPPGAAGAAGGGQ